MKYYVVKNGYIPGIYTKWEDCEKQVKNFSGAKYKSFIAYEDALLYLDMTTILEDKNKDQVKLFGLEWEEGEVFNSYHSEFILSDGTVVY